MGSFEDFLQAGAAEGHVSRARKWKGIEEGLDAPGVADMVRLYDAYLGSMNSALADREWLTGQRLTMADVALAPYLFRLSALAMDRMWERGRYPHLARWYAEISGRDSFDKAITAWVPAALGLEMRRNGEQSWPKVAQILGL